MFNGCSSIESVEALEQWNVENLGDASHLFHNCSSLKKNKGFNKMEYV